MESTATQLSDATKEQIKLRATFLNNIGIGVILVGVLTPTTRLIYGDISTQVSPIWLIVSPLACFLLGLALHLAAMKTLERLKA
ncbi:hypothetical protein KX729_06995 [Rhizobium sp. XQZ8]|uniref:hypothetical protein n=1 Tax=Rhizobium populisoli TaxID=2859785 RepID=UPI001CA4B8AC|nr:hypothetical protein [Rhizobium populisoli]MBW6421185.1 hypothetical protein [Rhizobium populisoli]